MAFVWMEPREKILFMEDHDATTGHSYPDCVQGWCHGCDKILIFGGTGNSLPVFSCVNVIHMALAVSIPGREDDTTKVGTPDDVTIRIKRELTDVCLLLFLAMDGSFESKVVKVEKVDVPCVSDPHTLLRADYTIDSML